MAEPLEIDENDPFYMSPMDVEQPPQIIHPSQKQQIESIVKQQVQPVLGKIADFEKIMMDSNMNDQAIQNINNNPTS